MKKQLHFLLSFLFFSGTLAAQQVSKAQLAKALQECEQDFEAGKQQIKILNNALNSTNQLINRHSAVSDSLITNLRSQLALQDSVTLLLKANADTLHLMVTDYSKKLDDVNSLYIRELKKRGRPWFLSGNGLTGLSYGLFVGGALGLIFGIAL